MGPLARATSIGSIFAFLAILSFQPSAGFAQTKSTTLQSVSLAEEPRLTRGEKIREVLLHALEQSYDNQGVWPEKLPLLAGGLKLVYTPPRTTAAPELKWPYCSVVLHEPIEQNPNGVWVGYADGHLEFASNATELASCENQLQIIQDNLACLTIPIAGEPTTQAIAGARGQLRLKVVDPQRRPVAGALVGVFGEFGAGSRYPHAYFETDTKPTAEITDARGEVTIAADRAFQYPYVYFNKSAAPLYVLDENRGLVAMDVISRSDFDGRTREITLQPACNVSIYVTSLGLLKTGRQSGSCSIMVLKTAKVRMRSVQGTAAQGQLVFPLPSGDYEFLFSSHDCYSAVRWIRVNPGQTTMDLQIDLNPLAAVRLIGQPAPELREIKGWENGGPVKLADLRGKVVLLDFWGYWCGPCVSEMPILMKLYDEFHDKSLFIIAIHDDSVESIQEMDKKLAPICQRSWGGRNLPFLIALDGGGPTQMAGTATKARGASTAEYGIEGFPTTLLIGRDGRLVGRMPSDLNRARAAIDQLLETK
jgi:thiol-disulfide isomerase/thioredoxin